MNNKEYVYIMDFNSCTINRIDITDMEDFDISSLLKKYGFNIDECDYMYSSKEINNINIIN